MTRPRLLKYSLNDDGTYSLCADIIDDNHGYKIDIPRVEIEWHFPKHTACFTLPVPVGFTILANVEGNMLTFALPDKD